MGYIPNTYDIMSRWSNPLIPSIDPNFQRDILAVLNHPPPKKKKTYKKHIIFGHLFFGSIKTKILRYVAFFPAGKFPKSNFLNRRSQQLTPQVNTSSPGANRSTPRSMSRALWGLIIEEGFGQKNNQSAYGFHSWLVKWASILLMEEIRNNHLGCIKPCK